MGENDQMKFYLKQYYVQSPLNRIWIFCIIGLGQRYPSIVAHVGKCEIRKNDTFQK